MLVELLVVLKVLAVELVLLLELEVDELEVEVEEEVVVVEELVVEAVELVLDVVDTVELVEVVLEVDVKVGSETPIKFSFLWLKKSVPSLNPSSLSAPGENIISDKRGSVSGSCAPSTKN